MNACEVKLIPNFQIRFLCLNVLKMYAKLNLGYFIIKKFTKSIIII